MASTDYLDAKALADEPVARRNIALLGDHAAGLHGALQHHGGEGQQDLLLGSLHLGIGALAATVRDVQTLSMPASMAQVGIFLFANYAMARPGSVVEIVACLFPFSSPFALMVRAAQFPQLWPHLALLLWQACAPG